MSANSSFAATQREAASVLSPVLAQVLSFDPTLSHPTVQPIPNGQHTAPVVYVAQAPGVDSHGFSSTGAAPAHGEPVGRSIYTGGYPLPYADFTPPSTIGHIYWAVAPWNQQTVGYWLKPYIVQRKTLYLCTWPTCPAPLPLTTKAKACAHVQKHLGITKLYECSCGVQFASLDSAKRHVSTQAKMFPCQFCLKHFARKDHRGAHQRKCRYRVST